MTTALLVAGYLAIGVLFAGLALGTEWHEQLAEISRQVQYCEISWPVMVEQQQPKENP